MNNNLNLPNLADWWPIPEGATLEQGDRYALVGARGDIAVYTSDNAWTPPAPSDMVSERRLSLPLPTEAGVEIIAVVPGRRRRLLTRAESAWRDETGAIFQDAEIGDWAAAGDLTWMQR